MSPNDESHVVLLEERYEWIFDPSCHPCIRLGGTPAHAQREQTDSERLQNFRPPPPPPPQPPPQVSPVLIPPCCSDNPKELRVVPGVKIQTK